MEKPEQYGQYVSTYTFAFVKKGKLRITTDQGNRIFLSHRLNLHVWNVGTCYYTSTKGIEVRRVYIP